MECPELCVLLTGDAGELEPSGGGLLDGLLLLSRHPWIMINLRMRAGVLHHGLILSLQFLPEVLAGGINRWSSDSGGCLDTELVVVVLVLVTRAAQ